MMLKLLCRVSVKVKRETFGKNCPVSCCELREYLVQWKHLSIVYSDKAFGALCEISLLKLT